MNPVPGISVSEAAARLGVNPSRVRAIIQRGLLEAEKVGHRWLVDPVSVDRRLRSRMPSGNPLGPEAVWAVLLMKAGKSVDWLSPWGRSRLKKLLREARVDYLVAQLAHRARLRRLRAHPSDLARIAGDPRIVLGGVSAAEAHDLNVSAPGVVEAYVPGRQLPRLLRQYRLQPSGNPNVLLHVVEGRWPFAPSARVVPAIVAAMDLLEADDPRSRRSGKQLFQGLWNS